MATTLFVGGAHFGEEIKINMEKDYGCPGGVDLKVKQEFKRIER